jgi:membrane-associated protein
MELITFLIDFILHIDQHLIELVAQYGVYIYLILFVIVFCETGFVVTPFLPGDSLLFAAGAIAATGGMDIYITCAVLFAAAVMGDNVNYWIGRGIGQRVFQWESSFLFNKKGFEKAHSFFEKYGARALVAARFMPIFRTFAPFTAGVAKMRYGKFVLVSVLGGAFWVGSITMAGYLFGNIPVVKNNLELVIIGIIVVSFLPVVIAFLKARFGTKPTPEPAA